MLFTGLLVSLTGLSACLASSPPALVQRGSYLNTLSKNQRELFNYAMTSLDANFGPPFMVRAQVLKAEHQADADHPQFESPRYTAWYGVGLLARNKGDDVAVASKIFRDV